MATMINNLVNNFINSWYGVVLVLGVVFVVVTHTAWVRLIDKLNVYFSGKGLTLATNPAAEEQDNVDDDEDYKKIQSVLSDLNIASDAEFAEFLFALEQKLIERRPNRQQVRALIKTLFTLKEQYEFAYLNLFLVSNSKLALLRLYELGRVTKNLWFAAFDFPLEIIDPQTEREIIFNVLYSHELIDQNNDFCKISDKGFRLLEFIGKL